MSNETDLDWLARKVHVWPEGKLEVLVRYPRNVDTLIWSCVLSNIGWITKGQWLARRAELQNKPSWASLPAMVRWIAQGRTGTWSFHTTEPESRNGSWFGGGCGYAGTGEVLGDWRDTIEKRPVDLSSAAVIKRLDEAAQTVLAAAPALMGEKFRFDRDDWFERGELPPVGIAVQLWHGGTYAYDCELIAKRGNDFVLWNLTWDRPDSADCMMCEFKPTPTEREVLADLIENHGQMSALIVADAILAAGFKRGAE